MTTRFMPFGEPHVITFLLAWCALSVVATLVALAMIRSGKRRHPQADDFEPAVSEGRSVPHAASPASSSSFTLREHEVPVN